MLAWGITYFARAHKKTYLQNRKINLSGQLDGIILFTAMQSESRCGSTNDSQRIPIKS